MIAVLWLSILCVLPEPQQEPQEHLTRTITYTYDPLHRLTGAEYSTGERYEYAYDAVGNRTAYTVTTPLGGTTVTTYTYDAANRLLASASPGHSVTYTWDDRGNLTNDGVFTYTYNAAGRLVRAQSITATIVYTYTADGLRVGQAVAGAVTTYAWDWASAVPELLSQSTNHQSTAYLVGHETLGWWDGAAWAYILADGLGSVRQAADATGAVAATREWDPYGVEVGGWRGGPGYTGEWQDADVGLVYLRARWYQPTTGRFTTEDPAPGYARIPRSLHIYVYAWGNPVNLTDPAGLQIPPPEECEPGEICYTGTTGAQVTRSSSLWQPSLSSFLLDPEERRRWCAQVRAEMMHKLQEEAQGLRKRPSIFSLYYDPLPSMYGSLCCAEPLSPQERAFWKADPLGQKVAGPITVDSGWHSFASTIVRGYGARLGGPAIIPTTVVFSSRMEATFVFYERGTTMEVYDWYNTRSFFWVQPWLGTLSLSRAVEVVNVFGEHFGPYSLGKVEGAQEGSGNLPYRLVYYTSPKKVKMRLVVEMPNTGIPIGAIKEYFIWAPTVGVP